MHVYKQEFCKILQLLKKIQKSPQKKEISIIFVAKNKSVTLLPTPFEISSR